MALSWIMLNIKLAIRNMSDHEWNIFQTKNIYRSPIAKKNQTTWIIILKNMFLFPFIFFSHSLCWRMVFMLSYFSFETTCIQCSVFSAQRMKITKYKKEYKNSCNSWFGHSIFTFAVIVIFHLLLLPLTLPLWLPIKMKIFRYLSNKFLNYVFRLY